MHTGIPVSALFNTVIEWALGIEAFRLSGKLAIHLMPLILTCPPTKAGIAIIRFFRSLYRKYGLTG
jgi:hypothetical protein